MLDFSAVDVETLTVTDEVRCAGCDYDLRTLAVRANCPECATPVAVSLIHRDVRSWPRRLRRGVTLLLLAPACLLAAYAYVRIASAVTPLNLLVMAPSFALHVAFALTGIGGVMLVTGPEPRSPRPNFTGNAARTALATAIALVVLMELGYAGRWDWTFIVGVFVGVTIGLMCTFAGLRRLAQRRERHGLCRLTTVLVWTLGAVAMATVGDSIWALIHGPNPAPWAVLFRTMQPMLMFATLGLWLLAMWFYRRLLNAVVHDPTGVFAGR